MKGNNRFFIIVGLALLLSACSSHSAFQLAETLHGINPWVIVLAGFGLIAIATIIAGWSSRIADKLKKRWGKHR